MIYEYPTTDKDELLRRVRVYLFEKDNSLLDLTAFVQENCPDTHRHEAFIRDIAHKLQRTGEFLIEVQKGTGRYLITVAPIKQKTWSEKHPVLNQFRTGAITLLFSLIGSLILYQIQDQNKAQEYTQQNTQIAHHDSLINNLQDSIKALRKTLNDSTHH